MSCRPDLIPRLKGARKNGDRWQANCPAHDDRTPSLSIADGIHGGVVLYCHAGCIAQHAAEYEMAISRLEQARDPSRRRHHQRLARPSPTTAPQPQVTRIDQPEVYADQPPRQWPHVLDDLRRDAATLPHRGPLTTTDKAIQRHRGFAAQEGGRSRRFPGRHFRPVGRPGLHR